MNQEPTDSSQRDSGGVFGGSLCSTFSLQQFDDLLWKAESKLRTSEKRLIAARNNFREARRRVDAMKEIRKEIVK